MGFILNSIKEKFEAGDKYGKDGGEGFPDLNYRIGNTSGLDVAPDVPSAMDERIGSLTQRGGGVMEVIINNPGTFQIDKERMYNVINQLGIDISLHSDASIGFASAYKTQSQGGLGYDPAHRYFTNYLQEFAIFKTEAEKREDLGFKISRINPHISTTQLPSLEERMAADVGQDPFGFPMNEITEESFRERDDRGQNIYKNREFLRKLYRIFIVEETGYEYQYYGFLADFSDEFEDEWRVAQKKALDEFWRETGGPQNGRLEDKIAIIRTASAQDPGSETRWLNILEDTEFSKVEDAPLDSINYQIFDERGNLQHDDDVDNLEDAETLIQALAGGRTAGISQLRRLPETYHHLHQTDAEPDPVQLTEDFEDVKKTLEAALESAVDDLWTGRQEDPERVKYNISIEAQTAGISNRLEIPQRRIQKRAFQLGQDLEPGIEESAQDVFAGDPDYFDPDDDDEQEDYFRFFRNMMRNFEQQLWMESNLFYKIIPAWMSTAGEHVEEDDQIVQEGWKAPGFLWKALVTDKWESREKSNGENYKIDLEYPNESDYFWLLENKREFQMDVAAASAACYVWGHFTQRKGNFHIENEKYVDNVDKRTTWIDWMNEYGIGVNLEAMPGAPQQLLKIWRPKDIVAAARAINITARNRLAEDSELGGRKEIHPDLDGCPAKFTIDLEHTATFGVNPWKEMQRLIDQERRLIEEEIAEEYDLEVEEEKPLAKILRMWHLMRPGLETSQSETLHGPWDRGDTQLYTWLHRMVDAGFARNPEEKAWIMYEVGGDDRGTTYVARIAMNLIELGVTPEELDPAKVDPTRDEYDDEKEALIARFFGMDKSSYDREWAKIEEHAFDPIKGLIEADDFDYTWSGTAAIERDMRPGEWMQEEYR